MKRSFSTKFLRSKVFLLILLIILTLLSISLSKELYRASELDKEIDSFKKEAARLESSNQEVSQLIEYLNTEAFVERVARVKLGLKKPGEKVAVILKNDTSQGSALGSKEGLQEKMAQELSNPQKWWLYFFKH